jgi:starch synthase
VELRGITNGINPALYRSDHEGEKWPVAAEAKKKTRRALLDRLGQPGGDVEVCGALDADVPAPLFSFVGRLTWQKGVQTLLDATEESLQAGDRMQFVYLGQGQQEYEERARELASRPQNRGRFALCLGYSEQLSRAVYAGGDFFLVPSEYEPCGLTDFIAQLHGNLPIVHRVGGLVKVRDGETGFSYDEQSRRGLTEAMRRAESLHQSDPQRLEQMRASAVKTVLEEYTWERVFAGSYLPLYREALAR